MQKCTKSTFSQDSPVVTRPVRQVEKPVCLEQVFPHHTLTGHLSVRPLLTGHLEMHQSLEGDVARQRGPAQVAALVSKHHSLDIQTPIMQHVEALSPGRGAR